MHTFAQATLFLMLENSCVEVNFCRSTFRRMYGTNVFPGFAVQQLLSGAIALKKLSLHLSLHGTHLRLGLHKTKIRNICVVPVVRNVF